MQAVSIPRVMADLSATMPTDVVTLLSAPTNSCDGVVVAGTRWRRMIQQVGHSTVPRHVMKSSSPAVYSSCWVLLCCLLLAAGCVRSQKQLEAYVLNVPVSTSL